MSDDIDRLLKAARDMQMGAKTRADVIEERVAEVKNSLLSDLAEMRTMRDLQAERLRIAVERAEQAEDERDALRAEVERLRETSETTVSQAAERLLLPDEYGLRKDVYAACEGLVMVYKFDAVLRRLKGDSHG